MDNSVVNLTQSSIDANSDGPLKKDLTLSLIEEDKLGEENVSLMK